MLKIADAANNLDLYKSLSELQTSVQALQEENRRLQDENKKLKEALELKAKMIHKPPFFLSRRRSNSFLSRMLGRRTQGHSSPLQPRGRVLYPLGLQNVQANVSDQ
jgi:hypothetical protein